MLNEIYSIRIIGSPSTGKTTAISNFINHFSTTKLNNNHNINIYNFNNLIPFNYPSLKQFDIDEDSGIGLYKLDEETLLFVAYGIDYKVDSNSKEVKKLEEYCEKYLNNNNQNFTKLILLLSSRDTNNPDIFADTARIIEHIKPSFVKEKQYIKKDFGLYTLTAHKLIALQNNTERICNEIIGTINLI